MRSSSLVAFAVAAAADVQRLSFFAISDTHFGHDVNTTNGTVTTSLSLNEACVQVLNSLPGASWPPALGGGPVLSPVATLITGDLIDNGDTEAVQWDNFTTVYGLTGSDGQLKYPVLEGRGNHDGGGNTTTAGYPGGGHFVPSMIVARNQLRLQLGSMFNITNISTSGLHYSVRWPVGDSGCGVHVFMMNLYAGHVCSGCHPAPSCFYGPTCFHPEYYPEDSLGFLQATLPNVVGASGEPVIVSQHYGYDGYSNDWYADTERQELWTTLQPYNVAGIFVGHTHSAAIYKFNGTEAVYPPYPSTGPALLDVFNIPSTQKEDNHGFPLPSEFLAVELAVETATGEASFRVAQRVGSGWGSVMGNKTLKCPTTASRGR